MLDVLSKYRFWVILAFLPVFCLSPAAVEPQKTYGRDGAGPVSKKGLYAFETAGAPSALVSSGERTRLKYFDSLVSVANGAPRHFYDGAPSSFRLRDRGAAVKHGALSILPIRAPPFRHS